MMPQHSFGASAFAWAMICSSRSRVICTQRGAVVRSAGRAEGSPSSSSSRALSPLTESLNSRMPLPSARPASGSRFGPRTIRAIARTRMSSMGPTLKGMFSSLPGDSPPHGGVEVLDLLDRTSVDPRGQVFPPVVADDEDDVALVELPGDAHGDRGDGPRGHAGEDPLLVEQAPRPDDRVVVRDEDLPVEQPEVDDRRDEAVVERAQPLHGLALHRLGGDDLDRVAQLLLE